ncbi:hypothetical protein PRIPAC_81615 [Pristionchus pacificus]|uniref:Signal peptidase complex catalytic subunit SEC11 n=1 Tax=Pristionchus pacificus TaxID=54126 RepID=A0A2A6CC27_PRIPA|nr:hypothetical protein PRIPAC_81615 [Pristionchus pacificus]|eukprot:PDM75638.1 hypothetical protein PRIPAC_42815 [Pristionchus pacificus]
MQCNADFALGDILILTNDDDEPVRVGDITVFRIEGREIPIVHRIIKIYENYANNTKVLTKGDNNQGYGPATQVRWLQENRHHFAPTQTGVNRQMRFPVNASNYHIPPKRMRMD